jgi:hypothetical protein
MRVIDELMWRLDGLQELIDQYRFCQERHFLDSDAVVTVPLVVTCRHPTPSNR